MYPRNAASPERIAVGPVVQISDGAVQTSGVSVKVKPQGGSAAAGEGTISYEEGVVGYVPTTAETNHTSFQVLAYKTGCIPTGVTVVTSAASVPGTVVPADDSITASTFDESTAFPLKSADTGSTTVARTGADADTLETLSDQMDLVALEATLTAIKGAGWTTETLAALDVLLDAIKAKTDNLPANPAAVGSAMTLTGAYDAAKGAASQSSVDEIPTNSELATALAGADDAVLQAIAALNNLSSAQAQAAAAAALAAYQAAKTSDVPSASTVAGQVRAELATELARVDVATSTRLASASYAAPPSAATVAGAVLDEAKGQHAGHLAQIPTNPYTGTPPSSGTIASAVRTELATELARVDVATSSRLASSGYTAPANSDVTAIKAVTDKLNTTLVQDGEVYDFTPAALAAAPGTDAGSIADAVADELLADHTLPGSVGAALAAAGQAGDPMAAPMGDYEEGTAGYEIHELYDQVTALLPDYPSVTVPAPPTAEQTSAWIRCLSQAGAPEAGVVVSVRLVGVDAGVDAYDMAPAAGTSDASGVAVVTIPRGAQYLFEARRGTTGRWVRFRGANVPTLLLPTLSGSP